MLQAAAAAVLAAGALAVTSSAASAYVVCNRAGDCWHTMIITTYDPAFGVGDSITDNWTMG